MGEYIDKMFVQSGTLGCPITPDKICPVSLSLPFSLAPQVTDSPVCPSPRT